jgi:hypothetical protein
MKTIISAALAATMFAGVALAHPSNEPHVCDIDPTSVLDYPGYAGKQGVWYDRGEYFFGFETKRFLEPVAYKGWSKVEAITTHYRVYKADCRVSEIEIVHTESKDTVEAAGNGDSDSRVAGVDYIVFSVSDNYQLISATYQGSTLQLEGADPNIDIDRPDANGITMREFIDQYIATLNQGAADGNSITVQGRTGIQLNFDFTDQDALYQQLGDID